MTLHRVSVGAAVKVLPPPYAHIYRVRTDVLLRVLGGFAEERIAHSSGPYSKFTTADLALVRAYYERFAAANGRLQHGRMAELAARLGRDRNCLVVSLSYYRRIGVLPPLGSAEPPHAVAPRFAPPSQPAPKNEPTTRPAWFANDFDKTRLMAGR